MNHIRAIIYIYYKYIAVAGLPPTLNMSPMASEAPRMVSPRIMKERKPVKKGLRHEKRDGNDADVFLTALHDTQTHQRMEAHQFSALASTVVREKGESQ
jgi:hypothetical protein